MTGPATSSRPLRVAVIGSGPTGFYAVQHCFKECEHVRVDLFEALPTPYGLVRGGVAPDHQKTKSVIKAYEKTAADPRFRFFGNVEVGRDVSVADLRGFYDAIIYTTGAQSDRRMGIPGEDLRGSYTATEFVAWYNGHPAFRTREFDLSKRSAVVVGVGNVAVDVARILCRTPEELATTDIADYALAALAAGGVREVTMLGRRGVAQAAFTQDEVAELGELPDADVTVLPREVELDPASRAQVEADRVTRAKVETVQGFAQRAPAGRPRRLVLRFLVSPVELLGDAHGAVRAVRVVRNALVATPDGSLVARATGEEETIEAGLVFRSVGYLGVAVPGVPFDAKRGVIPNTKGRVVDPATGSTIRGEYVAGWIKRGPQGVIGTNKPDALETVRCVMEDLAAGGLLAPEHPDPTAAEEFLRARCRRPVTWIDWKRLDEIETARGRARGAPRGKLTSIDEMLDALGR